MDNSNRQSLRGLLAVVFLSLAACLEAGCVLPFVLYSFNSLVLKVLLNDFLLGEFSKLFGKNSL